MKLANILGGFLISSILFTSCVAKRKYIEAENMISSLQKKNADLKDDITSLKERLYLMEDANSYVANELSQKDSLLSNREKDLAAQQEELKKLQALFERQKLKTQELHNKMLHALGSFKSEDLTVYTKNNKVYVSMSEKLLFPSGSAVVNKEGVDALGKIAQALNENRDINITVEGHTDSIPIKVKFEDNWALSVARSNSIIRILINNYEVDPERLTAAGRASFEPVADNSTLEGRAKNRRTEIVLAPKLDEIFSILNDR
jgi:chemotaxis protein MotB